MSGERANLTVFVDGVIYSYQRNGGITRILNEVLPRVCTLREDLSLQLWTWQHLAQPLPQAAGIERSVVWDVGFPRAARPAVLSKLARRTRGLVNGAIRHTTVALRQSPLWHSTLYWRPRFWKGRTVTSVYDLKEELFPDLSRGKNHVVRFKRDAITKADRIICISQTTKNDVVDFYDVPAEKIDIVYPAVDHLFWSPAAPQKNHQVRSPRDPSCSMSDVATGSRISSACSTRFAGGRSIPVSGYWLLAPDFTAQEHSMFQRLGLTDSVEFDSASRDAELLALYRRRCCAGLPLEVRRVRDPDPRSHGLRLPRCCVQDPDIGGSGGRGSHLLRNWPGRRLRRGARGRRFRGRAAPRVRLGLSRAQSYNWDSSALSLLSSYLTNPGSCRLDTRPDERSRNGRETTVTTPASGG